MNLKYILWSLTSFGMLALLVPDTHAAELEATAGYTYSNAQLGRKLDRTNLNGYNLGTTLWVKRWFGATADFGGLYGQARPKEKPANLSDAGGFDVSQHYYLFGPSFRLKSNAESRVTFKLDALAGVSRRGDVSYLANTTPGICLECPPRSVEFTPSQSALAYGFSGAMDLHLSKHLTFRVVQPGVVVTRLDARNQAIFRLTSGIVFHFGE